MTVALALALAIAATGVGTLKPLAPSYDGDGHHRDDSPEPSGIRSYERASRPDDVVGHALARSLTPIAEAADRTADPIAASAAAAGKRYVGPWT